VDPGTEAALTAFTSGLTSVDAVEAVWVGGSLATGDHVPGVSDLDLVALTSGPLTGHALDRLSALHLALDSGIAAGMDLGCQYADRMLLDDLDAEHPTWTHGEMVDRIVSLVTRAELVLHGFALVGPPPQEVLPPPQPGDVRRAAQAELAGYWSWAARHPRMFARHAVMVDLGLTGMARGRHAIEHDELLTKSAAIAQARAPEWLKDQLRARRRGEQVSSPTYRSAFIAWRDVRRTTGARVLSAGR
jgi:hypothetical protein